MLTALAPAKVNLSLEVLGRRADGFHSLVSIMQTVDLMDEITFDVAPNISVTASDPDLQGSGNLAARAASLLRSTYEVDLGCAIHINKRIPAAAGLGGGSSDAAVTLSALSALWRLDSACDALESVGAALGSDIPFFLHGGTALVSGRGTCVTRLRASEPIWYLIANPGFPVRTADVFANLATDEWSSGAQTRDLARRLFAGGRTAIGINSLQKALLRVAPAAEEVLKVMEELAPGRTLISGSGPTVISLFDTRDEAEAARVRLAPSGFFLFVARPYVPEKWLTPCA